MVAITDGVAEYEWQADHLVELGIAAHIRKADITADSLRQAAVHMSQDSHILQRVKEIESIVKREPGAEEAANCIESYLARQLN
jgi:UDP:flavonoid glycosyltransferase YjiC (YdhE family)